MATTGTAALLFSARFESGTAADTGTISYNRSVESLVSVNAGQSALDWGSQALLLDQQASSGTATGTDITLTPIGIARLADGVIISLEVVWRRCNTNTKDHYLTGYDSSGSPVFKLVMADVNAFATDSEGTADTDNDRQEPGYATLSSGLVSFAPSQIVASPKPGTFCWGWDSDSSDGVTEAQAAQLRIELFSSGWTLSAIAQMTQSRSFTTTELPFYSRTPTDLAYLKLTGETVQAGAYFDNITVHAVRGPEHVSRSVPSTSSGRTPDHQLIQGSWRRVFHNDANKRVMTPEDAKRFPVTWRIDETNIVEVLSQNRPTETPYRIDPSHEPGWIDIGKSKGLYELEENLLRIITGQVRPADFLPDLPSENLRVFELIEPAFDSERPPKRRKQQADTIGNASKVIELADFEPQSLV